MKIINIIKDTLMLFVITIVLVLLLSVAKVSTQTIIDRTNYEKQVEVFNEICPGFYTSNNITSDVVGASAGYNAYLSDEESVLRCKDKDGNLIGYIVKCTAKGYNGDLNLIVGFDSSAKVIGVRYATIPTETPGLGMKTTEISFLNSWIGKTTEDVNNVDTISGATITSEAFKQAMMLACMFANRAENMDGGL